MSEHKKRISKNALKILLEIICEDSFEGKLIKLQLPATRRISKSKEELWEYIRSELERRTDEHYDLATLSSGWYYILRKAESSLDSFDLTMTPEVAIQKIEPLELYLNEHMANRRRGGCRENEEEQEMKLTRHQMVLLSRQSTVTMADNNDAVELRATEKNEGKSSKTRRKRRTSAVKEKSLENQRDPATPEARIADESDVTVPMFEHLQPSRYHSTCSSHVSRNNSTMSVSGYDADNEKGLIKRRRKELKTRGERQTEVKIEVEDEENVEKTEEEQNEDEGKNGEDENEMMEEDEETREKEERRKIRERERSLNNMKGLIENLTDHILSLRIIGAIDTAGMESLADSFENAFKTVSNNKDSV